MKTKEDVFFDVFGGEFCEILHSLQVPSNINITEDGEVKEINTPVVLNGFIMEVTDGWVFLSPDGETIDQAVPLSDVRHISIVKLDQEEVDEIPEPEDKTYN